MKLSTVLAAVALADERKFANNPEWNGNAFLTGDTPAYWTKSQEEFSARAVGRVDAFWDAVMDGKAEILKENYHKIIASANIAIGKCVKDNGRRRRAVGDDRSWGSACIQHYGADAKYYCFMELEQFGEERDDWTNLNRFSDFIGRYIVEELYKPVENGSKKCQKRAFEIVSTITSCGR